MLSKHPLDFEALQRDSYISVEEIEEAMGTSRKSPDYKLKVLSLCKQIETQTSILCRVDGLRIRLMTHEEGAEHTKRQFHQRYRGMAYQMHRRAKVDVNALAPGERQAFEAQSTLMGMVVQSARAEMKKQQRLLGLLATTGPVDEE